MVNEKVAPSTGRETGRTCERKISKSCRSIRVKYRRASLVGIGNSGLFSLVVQYPEAPRDTTSLSLIGLWELELSTALRPEALSQLKS